MKVTAPAAVGGKRGVKQQNILVHSQRQPFLAAARKEHSSPSAVRQQQHPLNDPHCLQEPTPRSPLAMAAASSPTSAAPTASPSTAVVSPRRSSSTPAKQCKSAPPASPCANKKRRQEHPPPRLALPLQTPGSSAAPAASTPCVKDSRSLPAARPPTKSPSTIPLRLQKTRRHHPANRPYHHR